MFLYENFLNGNDFHLFFVIVVAATAAATASTAATSHFSEALLLFLPHTTTTTTAIRAAAAVPGLHCINLARATQWYRSFLQASQLSVGGGGSVSDRHKLSKLGKNFQLPHNSACLATETDKYYSWRLQVHYPPLSPLHKDLFTEYDGRRRWRQWVGRFSRRTDNWFWVTKVWAKVWWMLVPRLLTELSLCKSCPAEIKVTSEALFAKFETFDQLQL